MDWSIEAIVAKRLCEGCGWEFSVCVEHEGEIVIQKIRGEWILTRAGGKKLGQSQLLKLILEGEALPI